MAAIDLPVEQAASRVTQLGKAIALTCGSLEASATELLKAGDTNAYVHEAKPAKETPQSAYQIASNDLSSKESQYSQVAQILPDSAVSSFADIAKVKRQMLDVQAAFDKGIIDAKDQERTIKKLRHELSKAELRSLGAGGEEDVSGTSKWSKLTRGGLAEGIDGAEKGVKSIFGQLSGVGTGLTGLLGGVLPGGLSLFGVLLHGIKTADRLKTQLGEVVNIAVSAGGEYHGGGVKWMAGFQEKCQKFYGIAKGEVQGIFKNFVHAGLALTDVFATYDKTLGEAGTNAISLTLAADRHFELAGGVTSKAATQAITHFGMGLHEAVEKVTDIEFQARAAGFGVGGFIQWAVQSSMNVRGLGVQIEQVAGAAMQMRQMYEKMGVSSQDFAKKSTQEMLGGLSGMGMGREIWSAKKLGLGEGIEGRQNLREGLQRKDPAILQKMNSIWRKEAMVAGGGNEAQARFFLENSGFGFEGARAVMELGADSGKEVAVQGKKKEDRKKLKDAFVEESQKMSDFEKKKNKLLESLAALGKATMGVISNMFGIVVVAVKGIPTWFMGTAEERVRVKEKYEQMLANISKSGSDALVGAKASLSDLGSFVGPLITPLIEAWDFKYYATFDPSQLPREVTNDADRKALIETTQRQMGIKDAKVFELYQDQKGYVPGGSTSVKMSTVKALGNMVDAHPKSGVKDDKSKPPSEATVPPPPQPLLIDIGGGKTIQLHGSNIQFRKTTTWEAPTDAINLVADVKITVAS